MKSQDSRTSALNKPNSTDPVSVDIAIVGSGMVGSALAAALAKTNFSIALIDAQSLNSLARDVPLASSVEEFEPRVSALTVASQELLNEIDVWPQIDLQQVQPYQLMKVWDHLGTARIVFDAAEMHLDSLGCIVENQTIVSALFKVLQQQPNLQLFYGQKLAGMQALSTAENSHVLTLENGTQIQCKLLVAADGALSKIRQWAAIPTREWDYQHEAIVATVQTEQPHQATAWQRFSESGPLAFLPLADKQHSGCFSSIVWSQQSPQAKRLMALDDRKFCDELAATLEDSLGKVVGVSKRHAIPLRQRHAKSYVKPGIVLLGDAAHTSHPVAGQGVNLGFKDVKALADVLKKAYELDLEANNALLLRQYQRQRQGDNLFMMGVMEGFKRLFEQPDPVVRWLRNAGMAWIDQQQFLKHQIARHAMGLAR